MSQKQKESVFEATSKWDSKRKKPVKITHYIGWITDNGVVIPTKPKQSEARLKALEFEYNKMIEHQRELEEKRKAASEKPRLFMLSSSVYFIPRILSSLFTTKNFFGFLTRCFAALPLSFCF